MKYLERQKHTDVFLGCAPELGDEHLRTLLPHPFPLQRGIVYKDHAVRPDVQFLGYIRDSDAFIIPISSYGGEMLFFQNEVWIFLKCFLYVGEVVLAGDGQNNAALP